MLASRPNRKYRHRGFTVLEVLIAAAILVIGMVALASMAGTLMGTGNRSKYMSLAAVLASEKLEDLNHWYGFIAQPAQPEAPQICVPNGQTSVGSLTTDVLQTTTCAAGASAPIAYYDDVSIGLSNSSSDCPNPTAGCFAETLSSLSGGNIIYNTTYHSPDGNITTSTSSTAPTNTTFHRRWIIEANTPVTGVRRITVLVTLKETAATTGPTVTFQMSLVRP
jgi:prepilin-type N-terminal cleavage/methylation domain-containing protein